MKVIGHQHSDVNIDKVFFRIFSQPAFITWETLLAGKVYLAIISTLDNVLRNNFGANPRQSGHIFTIV